MSRLFGKRKLCPSGEKEGTYYRQPVLGRESNLGKNVWVKKKSKMRKESKTWEGGGGKGGGGGGGERGGGARRGLS